MVQDQQTKEKTNKFLNPNGIHLLRALHSPYLSSIASSHSVIKLQPTLQSVLFCMEFSYLIQQVNKRVISSSVVKSYCTIWGPLLPFPFIQFRPERAGRRRKNWSKRAVAAATAVYGNFSDCEKEEDHTRCCWKKLLLHSRSTFHHLYSLRVQ